MTVRRGGKTGRTDRVKGMKQKDREREGIGTDKKRWGKKRICKNVYLNLYTMFMLAICAVVDVSGACCC